jgi:PAS domain S-box-containing protein
MNDRMQSAARRAAGSVAQDAKVPDAAQAKAFQQAALAVSRVGGPNVYADLVASLASVLAVDVAFVAVFRDEDPATMRTLAAWLDGRELANFDYALAGTPCAEVVGGAFRHVPSGVRDGFKPDTIFAAKGMDSYAAYPLADAAGAPLGLLVTMKRTPIPAPDLAEAVLKIFAVRIAAEIERGRTEAALRRAALAVSSAQGDAVFRELVRDLASILNVDMAFIAQPKDGDRARMSVLAASFDGAFREAFEYDLAGTPCETIVGHQYRAYPAGLREQFPGDLDFAEFGFESYAGFPLANTRGLPLGIISIVSRRPLANPALVESILKIFAVRAAAEIERMHADEALRVSEASYRSIFEAAEDAIFIHDPKTGVIVDANPSACSSTGYTREELRRLSVDDLGSGVPPYTGADAARHIREAQAGRPVRIEWHRKNKDGTLHWDEVYIKAAVIAGERRLIAVTREITERKQAEEALRASEEQYRTIFNASVDGLVLKDADHRIVDVNEAYLAMHGYRREQVLGQRMSAFIPAELQARCEVLLPEVLAGEPCHIEARTQRHDGTTFEVEIHGVPIRYGGRPHALVVMRDITQAKRAEEALRASEEQYRAMFAASEDALILWDSSAQRVDVNPAYEQVFGWTREEVIGRGYESSGLPEEYTRPRLEMVRRTLAGEPCQAELVSVRKNGERFHADIRTIPIKYRGEPHVLATVRDVTQRRLAEEALRASEEQYRAIFNGSADALVLRDADFRIVDVNAAYETLSGRRRDAVVGVGTLTLTAHDDPAKRRELHANALAGRPIHFETEARRGDGTAFVIEVRGVPMSYRGKPHVLYMGRDVTENRLAERALRASEEQYRAIFTASADGIVLRDADFRVVDVNPAALAMVGKSRAEVVGSNRLVVIAESERERVRAMHRRVLGGASIRYEVEGVGADGRRMDLEIRLVPMQHQGRPHVLAIARDLTEMRAVAEALRVSGEQYRAIFDAAVDALVLRDRDFRIVDVNPAYEAMTGYALAEVAGADHVVANPPEVDAHVKALHQRALAGEPVQTETQILARNGNRLEVELRGLPIRHQGMPHVLYVGRDITARKRAEAERLALEAQLRQAQKMEAIGHLTGGIAHDFNNILTSVMGYVGLAAERESAGADAKLGSYLEQALRSCRRARDLIQQMLVFSRGQRGERVPVDLAPIVEESSRLLRSTLPATLQLATELDAPLPRVRADRVQAEQVLLNLAINARDAMAGGGTLTIGLAQHRIENGVCASCRKPVSGRFVALSVADTGPGIPPEVMDRMFEPFFSTKEVGKGSGMGLATVHGIVHDHGGHVLVESAPGQGTTFRVLLPMLEGIGVPAATESAASEPPRARQSLQGRVLVVDDEASVAAFMQELLAGWGLDTAVATDPRDALERLRGDPGAFDLVVTDLTMPGMTGIQFARAIAAIDPALPVILSTGYSDGVSEDALRGANIRALLRKPIETAALRGLVEAELGGAQPG